jgi:hypothetical protein
MILPFLVNAFADNNVLRFAKGASCSHPENPPNHPATLRAAFNCMRSLAIGEKCFINVSLISSVTESSDFDK